MEIYSANMTELMTRTDLLREWPPLAFMAERFVYRIDEIGQSLYDLLAGHASAQSTDPRDKIFALMGLVTYEEKSILERSFPNYSLSVETVIIVTLAHLTWFAGDKPLRPVFRALRLDELGNVKLQRLLLVLERLDYLGEDSPAATAELIAIDIAVSDEESLSTPKTRQLVERLRHSKATLNSLFREEDDPDWEEDHPDRQEDHAGSEHRRRRFDWGSKAIGLAVGGCLLYAFWWRGGWQK